MKNTKLPLCTNSILLYIKAIVISITGPAKGFIHMVLRQKNQKNKM